MPAPPLFDLVGAERELIKRKGLHEFVRRAWPLIEPGEFRDNWHIGLLCEVLEAVHRREIKRAILNVPPGCMKSLTVSTFWPAWTWTLEPAHRFIFATYEAGLALDHARKQRDVVSSEWYQDRWPVVGPAASKKAGYFMNTAGGFRYSTSVGGAVTGRHARTHVIDDPIKPKDTQGGADETRKMLKKAEQFWAGTMATRRDDPAKLARLIIMQRLHDADLAGVELAKGGYVHVMLPMRYEPKRAFSFSFERKKAA